VTNFTVAAQAGSLAISLTDTNGTVVTNFSLSVSVGGWTGVSFNYALPGTLSIWLEPSAGLPTTSVAASP
jgi:hypothetical protein